MKFSIITVLILGILYSCSYRDTGSDFETQILKETLGYINVLADSSLIIRNIQGSFYGDSVKDNTMRMFYCAFYIGSFSEVDSIKEFSNIQESIDTIGYRMHDKSDFPNKIASYDISFLSDFVINKTDSRFFILDWKKLKNNGIKSIYTFSEITINDADKYGLIGIQQYTQENFKIMSKYFSFEDSVKFFDLWEGNFEIVDLRCRFNKNELSSIEPNSMIIK